VQLLVVTAAADQTGRTISLLVAGLVGIAVALLALTVWYWRHTDPKRRARSRSIPEPGPVEVLDPRIDPVDHVDRIDDLGARPSPDVAPVDVPRPVVASIPPTPLPASSPPLPAHADDAVAGIGPSIPRRWVDPDVWVDAFAADPSRSAPPPGLVRPPVASRPVPLPDETDHQVWPVDHGSDAWSQMAENLRSPADREPTPGDQEAAPAGHSLSDVEWDAITQAAFSRFAETESEGPAEVNDQSPVR
jgi:hypothetical protein